MRLLHKYNLFSLRKRILALVVLISFIFCAIIIRLSVVQLIQGSWLQAKAVDQWTRDLSMTAERGKIFDITGSSLAVSYTTYNLYSRGREIKDPIKTATFLSNVLGINYQSTFEKLSNKSVSEVLIKLQVNKEQAIKIITSDYKGLYLSENISRYYPYGDLLTQVLGFTTIDNMGQAGIEAFYDNMLKGLNGKYLVESDLQGKKLDNTISYFMPSIPGMNVTLTIDSKIQLIVEQTLKKIMLEQQAKSSTAIVMDAQTGEIIALSIKPSFNLNEIPRDNVEELMKAVKNSTVVDVYEPGSTFKILTVASALETDKVSLSSTFYDPGYRIVDGQKIKCWKTIGHGNQTLIEGFCHSCNSVFVDLALRMGKTTFYEYLQKFGIGSKTQIDIAGESAGLLMEHGLVKNVDLARIGFGQAVAVTPLQLITAFCAAVNGGNLMKPYIVDNVKSNNNEVVIKSQPLIVRKVISENTSSLVNQLLEAVASKQGKASFVPGYSIGGKTGTAQKYENGQIASGKYVSSFFGTFPVQNPKYALLLLVDEPGSGQYYGSVVAAPYAKDIFSGIFEYKNIAPINLEQDLKLIEKNIEMPELSGLSLSKACTLISSLGLLYEIDGDGGIVVSQYPTSGVMLYNNQTVVIKTN